MNVFDEARSLLLSAGAVLITAGAGMGVDSGLPDFRGDQGFWRAYPPLAGRGISFQQMANPRWFVTEPRLAWGFYGHRLQLYQATTPHSGFYALLNLLSSMRTGGFVFTSNVDGQFQRAGFDSNAVVECHGSIHRLQCVVACGQPTWSADAIWLRVDEETLLADGELPTCPSCGSIARPNILMFNDLAWDSSETERQWVRLAEWIDRVEKLVVIEIGAGLAIPTVRELSEQVSHRSGVSLIRVNPRDSTGPPGTLSISLGAREALEQVCA